MYIIFGKNVCSGSSKLVKYVHMATIYSAVKWSIASLRVLHIVKLMAFPEY